MGLVASNWNITLLHSCTHDTLTAAGTAEQQVHVPAFNLDGFKVLTLK